MKYRCILEVDVKGKTLLFNSMMDLPMDGEKIDSNSGRFVADVRDLKQLSGNGAKLVVFTWQSRPGKKDFLHLDQHAQAVARSLGKEVKQFKWNEKFIPAIKQMKEGDIIFLDNVRMRPDQQLGDDKSPEDYAGTEFVKLLSPLADCFCNNAFSQSHRNECSVLGFTAVLPSFVGPSLKDELTTLNKARYGEKPRILVLGGMKNADSLEIIINFLKNDRAELVLAGGFLGQLLLQAKGVKFGKTYEWIEKNPSLEFTGLVDKAKKVMEEFGDRILLPVDVAVDANGERKSQDVESLPSEFRIKDIGDKTIELFSEKLNEAKTIIWNGPMGVYEEDAFIRGTKGTADAIAKSDAYTVIGGGDTQAAAERTGLKVNDFCHVSAAGKAFLRYISGMPLVALTALEQKTARGKISGNYGQTKQDVPASKVRP